MEGVIQWAFGVSVGASAVRQALCIASVRVLRCSLGVAAQGAGEMV